MYFEIALDSKVTSGSLIYPNRRTSMLFGITQELNVSFFANLLRNMSSNDQGRQQRHGSSSRSSHHGKRDGGHRQDGYEARGASCASCRSPLIAGAKFCAECGTSATPRACATCSIALVNGARFCASCGTAAA